MSKTAFEKVTHNIDINELFVKSSEKVYLHWTNKLIHDLELTLDCKVMDY